MIKNFTPRLYQEAILATAVKHNTLIVLPTGLGKTNIFLMLAAHRLHNYPDSQILLVGPTKPLIDQYYEVFKNHFKADEADMVILTGAVKPDKRVDLWNNSKIIFSTCSALKAAVSISNKSPSTRTRGGFPLVMWRSEARLSTALFK